MSDVDDKLDIEKLRADLQQTENELSPEIVQRLQAARREAVRLADERDQRSSGVWLNWQRLSVAAGLASIAFAVAIVLQSQNGALPMAEEHELAVAEDMELLEELEFVAWMVALENEELPNSG